MTTDQRMVLPPELRGLYSDLIKLAAELVRGLDHHPFEEGNFYVSTPKCERQRVLKMIEDFDERCRLWGIRARDIADKLPRVPS
jgi:hypothetical protein